MPHSLADAIFWVAVVCCAVAQWFIVRGAMAAHAVPPGAEQVPATRRATETAWAVLPAVALVLALGATWRAMHPPRPPDHTPTPEHTAVRPDVRAPA